MLDVGCDINGLVSWSCLLVITERKQSLSGKRSALTFPLLFLFVSHLLLDVTFDRLMSI